MSNTNQHGVQVNTVPNNTHVGSFSSAGESTYSVSYSMVYCMPLWARRVAMVPPSRLTPLTLQCGIILNDVSIIGFNRAAFPS